MSQPILATVRPIKVGDTEYTVKAGDQDDLSAAFLSFEHDGRPVSAVLWVTPKEKKISPTSFTAKGSKLTVKSDNGAIVDFDTKKLATIPQKTENGNMGIWLEPGKKVTYGGKELTLQKVIDDSRCPLGVDCVWAGEAKFEVKLVDGSKTKNVTISSIPQHNVPIRVHEVSPIRAADKKIPEKDYRVLITIAG